MSENLPTQPTSDEVDLGQLFKLIGNAFDRLFKFIGSIFKILFSVLIYALKAIIENYKPLIISMLLAGVVGYGLERIRPNIYDSQMFVKPYFDSKYQLVTNINYYNALIEDEDYEKITKIFNINDEDAKQLIEFEIIPGPETENDRIKEFESFIKGVDSTRAQNISYDDFVENRSIYTGSFFQINVKSFKKDIFRSLEKGLNSTFTNTYSIKKMQKRDSLIAIDKKSILKSLAQVDSLKRVYIKVMQEESSSNGGSITLKDGMSLVQERVKTREFELLNKELELRQALTSLESQKVEEDVYFDTLSSFQDVGARYSSPWAKYSIIFPILTFFLLSGIYLASKAIIFIKAY